MEVTAASDMVENSSNCIFVWWSTSDEMKDSARGKDLEGGVVNVAEWYEA